MSSVPKRITDQVDVRDEFRCQRCGVSLTVIPGSRHHRLRRRVGGHSVEVLILLCGSGVSGCHGFVHANPAKARKEGLIIPANGRPLDPAEVPVLTHKGHWYLFNTDGTRTEITAALASETMTAFGLHTYGEDN